MTSRHCPTCNAVDTAEHPLLLCDACENVVYCNRTCQKAHRAIHKPACLATVLKYQDSDEDTDDGEDADQKPEENANVGQSTKDENDNLTIGNVTYPVGTYIEWFEAPTPDNPSGSKSMINLDKLMVILFASLSDEESKFVERQMIEGYKSGDLKLREIFHQIAKQKGMKPADFQDRAEDPDAYEDALEILAGRCHAAKPKEVDISKCSGSTFVRYEEEGDVVFLDANTEEFVVPADAVMILELEEDEGIDGELELVFFDSDTMANMKYLRDDEKFKYKEMLAQDEFEQRYPGKTGAEVAADKKEYRASAQAEMEAEPAEQESIEDGFANMNLAQE